MSFIPAGEILGETSRIRTLTLRGDPDLPDGAYSMVDTYCTDPGCDCRKTMIMVHHDRRHVSTINFGWETPAFYRAWFGAPLDAQTLAEMRGPCIDLTSPDLVPPGPMLEFFISILDEAFCDHIRTQYQRFRAAVNTPAGSRRLATGLGGGNRGRNQPCPCGSGRKFKHCCGRDR